MSDRNDDGGIDRIGEAEEPAADGDAVADHGGTVGDDEPVAADDHTHDDGDDHAHDDGDDHTHDDGDDHGHESYREQSGETRVTAPMQSFGGREVGVGLLVLAAGVALAYLLPYAVA